jgi:hypothetical protein
MTSVSAGQPMCGAPGGIEPPTPSSPWNHQEPLCGPRFSQVTLDRQGRSYGFCFDAVMRSLLSGVVAAVGSSGHSVAAVLAAVRIAAPSTSIREVGIPHANPHTDPSRSGALSRTNATHPPQALSAGR